jgi:ligand-binding sensor domain-containing protein
VHIQRFAVKVSLSGILGLSYCVAQPNQTNQWRNSTDMKSVRSVGFSSDRLVAATGGGMFMYDKSVGRYSKWTNSENLSTNDLTALMVDRGNRIWVGSSDGAIDVFDQSAGSWQTIQDIANSSRPKKAIRGFLGSGDSVFVVSDFGVSVFIVSQWEFGDTYASFGFPTQPAVSRTIILHNQIFVGSDQGVASASLSSPNLSAPTSWTTYASAQGLSANGVTSMTVFHDTLLVGSPDGIFFFTGNSFQFVISSAGKSVIDIASTQDAYYFVWNGTNGFTTESIAQVNGASQLVATKGLLQASSLATNLGTSEIAVGTTNNGVVVWDGSNWSARSPNGPASNLFTSLCVTANGVLWSGTGIGGGGKGFYRYDPSLADGFQWKNFTVSSNSILGSNDYYKASLLPSGAVWLSSWGDGVIEIEADTIRRKLNATTTPSFAATVPSSTPQGPFFVVVGGVAEDPQGLNWFVNRTAVNGNFLTELINDTTFQYKRCSSIPCDGFFSSIVIDQNGTKWMANAEPTQKIITGPAGLYYYNENLTVAGTENSGGWGMMTTSDGLPNDIILSLAVDQDNSVWVGTDLGVNIITDPLNPLTSKISSFPLREQSIQTIAVDGLNDKWIGTKEGVFVVNSDGTQLISQYTVINTGGKLVDNDVRSIAIDQRRGIAYIGTQNGLSSLQIPAVQSQQAYTKLEFGPNPFTLPGSQPLTISNLVSNSTIKILSINGTLIAEFPAQGGGRAFWDGRDRRGNYVATGIYFVVAFADNGNQVANGKVAVVRK